MGKSRAALGCAAALLGVLLPGCSTSSPSGTGEAAAARSPAGAEGALPRPEPPFGGTIGRTGAESKPDCLLEGRPTFCYNLAGVARYTIAGDRALAPGAHTLVYDFKYEGGLGTGGEGSIQVDGKVVATGRIERTLPFRLSLDETLDCGADTGTPVCEDCRVPFKFTGEIRKAVIGLGDGRLAAGEQKVIDDAARERAKGE
jgi:hypothetical protein